MISLRVVQHLRLTERVLYILAFCIFSYMFLSLSLSTATFTAEYQGFIQVSFVLDYILLGIAFFFVVTGRARSGLLRTSVTVATCIALLCLGVFLFGVVQDMFGTLCTNALGAASSCSSGSMISLTLILLFPSIFASIEIICVIFLTLGLMHELALQLRKLPQHTN